MKLIWHMYHKYLSFTKNWGCQWIGEWGGEHPKATKKFNEYNKVSTLTSPKNSLQNVVKVWNFLLPSLKKFDLSVDRDGRQRGAALYPIRGGLLSRKVVLKLLVFSWESLWWSVIFVNHHASNQWSFSFFTPLQVFSFLASSVIFGVAVFESTFERLLLEQHFTFRDVVIRP